MYKHYDSSEDVFVDREEYIEWMSEALERCKDKAVVLHLRGIGGIGKSSLLDHWRKTVVESIPLDCQQHTDFYDRLNVLAKGAALDGIRLQRFDVLWQIRQRFVEGVEPVKQEGREWAKEIAMAIPFIGSLASIGSAISAAGSKIAPKLKGKYSTVGKWLEDRLGKNHVERLLEILWKEPRNAEFLYLDALLEDLNDRKSLEQPILFLFDHFEYVDNSTTLWRYGGKKISEAELWCVFLSSLNNGVGVLGSRRSSPATGDTKEKVEEKELTELDEASTCELLEKREVSDKDLQEKIVSVSGGNPFVIDAICDMKDAGTISLDDVECLRAETLDEVRLMTWRRLFNMAVGLQDIINRAGLMEFFDHDMMDIIAPSMTSDLWDQLLRLSFVRFRDDGKWVLHDLARELIIAELGSRGKSLAEEVALSLEKESEKVGNFALIGHAFSIRAIFIEEHVIEKAKEVIHELVKKDAALEALQIIQNTRFQSMKGKAELLGLKGKTLALTSRFPEAEEAIREAIRINEELAKEEPEKHLGSVAEHLCDLWDVLQTTRIDEAIKAISRALEIQRTVAEEGDPKQLKSLAWILVQYGLSQRVRNPLDGISPMREAIAIYRKIKEVDQVPFSLNALGLMLFNGNKWDEADEAIREAIELQRGLIESEPDNLRLKSILAAMIHNLAYKDGFLGDLKEAERLYTEALQIRRGLADKDPNVYLQRLVGEIWSYSILCIQINRLDESEKLSIELLELAQEKAEESPEEYEPWIERAHITLSYIYSISGKTTQAISSINQAIEYCRKRVQLGSTVLSWVLPLNVSAAVWMRSGEQEKAEEVLLELIQIFRNYGKLPHRFHADFALCLNNHGIILRRRGKLSDAKATLEEALEISRGKVEELPEAYKGLLSIVQCNLAILLAENDELDAAVPHFQESLAISEHLANRTPERYKIHLAIVLHNYSQFLLKADRKSEAYSNLMRAVDIKREITRTFPGIFEVSLVASLRNLSVMLREANSSDLDEVLHEVVELREQMPNPSSREISTEENREMEWEEKFGEFGETP